MKNSFEMGPEGWCSYDYHASMVSGGTNVFILAVWNRDGGPGGTGCVWSDHTRWSADTPEKPLSILPFLFYRSWVNAQPVDLRGAELSVYLRGDGLVPDGAQCQFWVHGSGGRWHMNSHPMDISENKWATQPNKVTLVNDESAWHHSWPQDRDIPSRLDTILGHAHSYGFSFTGFSAEVTGRLSMADFEIRTA